MNRYWMITLLVIIFSSLVISGFIYSLIHLGNIKKYLDSVHWIQGIRDWIANLPEFIQIFLSILMVALFVTFLVFNLRETWREKMKYK